MLIRNFSAAITVRLINNHRNKRRTKEGKYRRNQQLQQQQRELLKVALTVFIPFLKPNPYAIRIYRTAFVFQFKFVWRRSQSRSLQQRRPLETMAITPLIQLSRFGFKKTSLFFLSLFLSCSLWQAFYFFIGLRLTIRGLPIQPPIRSSSASIS